jgi:hypothetical protein
VDREGSAHTIYLSPAGKKLPIPRHGKIKRFTLRGALKEHGIDWARFVKEL